MKQKLIWMAVVTDEGEVVFSKACRNKSEAEKAIVGYLRKDREFEGGKFEDACFWIGENDLRLNLMVFDMPADDLDDISNRGLQIGPPSKEKDLYRVVYVIDIAASNHKEAARLTHAIMTDTDSIDPFLEVIDTGGKIIKMDLSKKTKGR